MAIIRSLRLSFSADTTRLKKGMQGAKGQVSDFKRAVENVNQAASFGKLLAALGGVEATFKGLAAGLNVINGNTELAVENLKSLPFGIGPVVDAYERLLGAATGAADAIKAANAELKASIDFQKEQERINNIVQGRTTSGIGILEASKTRTRQAGLSGQALAIDQLQTRLRVARENARQSLGVANPGLLAEVIRQLAAEEKAMLRKINRQYSGPADSGFRPTLTGAPLGPGETLPIEFAGPEATFAERQLKEQEETNSKLDVLRDAVLEAGKATVFN